MPKSKPKFKVVGYDSFSNEEYPIGSYVHVAKAIDVAQQKGGSMNICYVYDPDGKIVHKSGTY